VWCTSWNQLAASWIARRLDLPDTRPHVPLRGGGLRFGRQTKLDTLYAWAGRRPLAVLDDEFGGKDADTAALRSADGGTHPAAPGRPAVRAAP